MKITNIEELNSVAQEKNILFYGAGRVGMTMAKFFSIKGFAKPKAVLVSNMGNNPEKVLGIPVIEIDSYTLEDDSVTLICCVMEKLQDEIKEEIEKTEFKNVYYITDDLYNEVIYLSGSYDVENYFEIKRLINEEEENRKRILKFQKKPCLEYLIFNILDHCNLRCRGCDHFACIADPYIVSYDSIHNDMARISELFGGKGINKIAIMGGEPLLHPDLLKIIRDARKYFPYSIIRLTTNGILLLQQSEEFWDICKEYNITIVTTKYPLKTDYEQIERVAKEKGVKFHYFEGTGKHILKMSFKKNIDLTGDGNPVENFAKCTISNYVNFVMEGNLYECPFSCQSHRIFNKKFNQNLLMTEDDFINIYEAKNKDEILEFTAKPKYYCRYCSKGLTDYQPWSRSKGEITEWIDKQ